MKLRRKLACLLSLAILSLGVETVKADENKLDTYTEEETVELSDVTNEENELSFSDQLETENYPIKDLSDEVEEESTLEEEQYSSDDNLIDEAEESNDNDKEDKNSNQPIASFKARSVQPATLKRNVKAKIIKNSPIYSELKSEESHDILGTSEKYLNEIVDITLDHHTKSDTYSLIYFKNKPIGWISRSSLLESKILSSTPKKHVARVDKAWSINTRPWGTENFKFKYNATNWMNQLVEVTHEEVTPRSTYSLISKNGNYLGWIDKRALTPLTVLRQRDAHYSVKVRKPWSINSRPWGTEGYKFVNNADTNLSNVVVTSEIDTLRSTYTLLTQGDRVLGWLDKRAIEKNALISTAKSNYHAFVRKPWAITSKPWGLDGFVELGTGNSYLDKEVQVINTAQTKRSTYSFIVINGKKIGWIDNGALGAHPSKLNILAQRDVHYSAKIRKPWSINTKPWGTAGFKFITNADKYLNNVVVIKSEIDTHRSTYSLLTQDNKIIGWLDKRAIEQNALLGTNKVNYKATVKLPWAITTKPWGINGFEQIGTGASFLNQQVQVLNTARTKRSNYSYIRLNNVIGWIDSRALDRVTKVIYLDPGHGGYETGASYSGVHEKNLNLSISHMIAKDLRNAGYKVVMSRTNDKYVDLFQRPKEANQIGADILVSVHHNAHPAGSHINGIETYYYGENKNYPPLPENKDSHLDPTRVKRSVDLAGLIHKELIKNTGAVDRGIRPGAFVVNREAKMPAVLLELGFMSNPTELRKVQQWNYKQSMTNAIVNGIKSYFSKVI